MQIAPNGNSTGANDPNFIHFAEEQAGTLLPNAPGYPFFLPSLQISPKGRLCFWNFPNKILKAVVSNPSNAGTSNYLRDTKNASSKNLFPPIPSDLGTNGSSNQYFWACDTYFIVTSDFANEVINQKVSSLYYGNILSNPNLTPQSVYDDFVNDPGNVHFIPEVGKYIDTYLHAWSPWYWIQYNIQYYINKFLDIPYDVSAAVNPQYGDSWTGTLSKEAVKGDIATWLGGANFFVNLVANPDFLQSLSNALPVVFLTAATLVSGGLATPALGAIIAADKAAATKSAQQTNIVNQLQKGGDINPVAVAKVAPIAALSTISEAEWIFFAFGFLILILVIIFYKNK